MAYRVRFLSFLPAPVIVAEPAHRARHATSDGFPVGRGSGSAA